MFSSIADRMTSLARQLGQLKTAVTSQLGAERATVSFLFDKKQAAALDRETIYQIGLTGLAELKKIDADIDAYEPDLFTEDKVNFQRSLLTADQNEKLNASLEKMLFCLAPYFQHTACQQVLEWLIFKYHIHTFNGADVAAAFFPYHNTSVYARLISILELKNTSWFWLKPHQDAGRGIPFHAVLRHCNNFNYEFLTTLSNIVKKAIKVVGTEFLEKKCTMYFTMLASIMINMIDDGKKDDNAMIGKVLPIVSEGLKSKCISYKYGAMMIVCQLASTVELATGAATKEGVEKSDVVGDIMKMLMLKMKPEWFNMAMQTLIVLCQRQNVDLFPAKAFLKLLRKMSDLEGEDCLVEISKQTELHKFLVVAYKSMFDLMKNNKLNDADVDMFFNTFKMFLNTDFVTQDDAMTFFEKMFDLYGDAKIDENKEVYGFVNMPQSFRTFIRGFILRFIEAFDAKRAEWILKDVEIISKIMNDCRIESHEVQEITMDIGKAKKRKRLSSTSNALANIAQGNVDSSVIKITKVAEKETVLESVQVPTEVKKPFKGSCTKITEYISSGKVKKILWSLKAFEDAEYVKEQMKDDLSEFAMTAFSILIKGNAGEVESELKSALFKITYSAKEVMELLCKPDVAKGPTKKKPVNMKKSVFANDTAEENEKRVVIALDVFKCVSEFPVNSEIIALLFELFNEETNKGVGEENPDSILMQLKTLALLKKAFLEPGKYKIKESDLKLESIVKHIRHVTNLNILRDSTTLLISCLNVSPVKVASQIMSVFTFMGTTLIKKDNSLTLKIFEDAATALFQAVKELDFKAKSGTDHRPNEHLIGMSKVLCQSILDIPIHRRMIIVRLISKSAGPSKIWIVILILFEEYCMKWQKNCSEQQKLDFETFEVLCLDMVSQFTPEIQFHVIHDILNYIIYLGGDKTPEHFNAKKYPNIVDREKFSVPKLRHLRFIILGFITKLLTYKPLYDKFLPMTDDQITKHFNVIGKSLLLITIEIDEFLSAQLNEVEKNQKACIAAKSDTSALDISLKYWLAICARGDSISDKIRNLLPGSISGNIISDLLNESDKMGPTMRDKTLQLLNSKLAADGFFETRTKMTINSSYLIKFATKLREWIIPAESKDEINRCRNAFFTLKLLVHHCTTEHEDILMDIFNRCIVIIKGITYLDSYMVGSALLLASEIFKMKNMKIIILHAEELTKICLETLIECDQVIDKDALSGAKQTTAVEENMMVRRRRVSKQSICGKSFGADALFICSLTCLQRITEVAIPFIAVHVEKMIRVYCSLSYKYSDIAYVPFKETPSLIPGTFGHRANSIKHRLKMIGEAIGGIEMKVVIKPIEKILLGAGEFNPGRLSIVFNILTEVFSCSESSKVIEHSKTLSKMFLALFDIRKHSKSDDDWDIINTCELNLIEAFLNFFDCLSEKDVGPIFGEITQKLHMLINGDQTTNSIENLQLVTYFNFFSRFYDVYTTVALPHFGKIFELTGGILDKTNSKKTAQAELLLYGHHNTFDAKNADALIVSLLEFVSRCAQNREFMDVDRARSIYESVIDEIENTKISGHEDRCVKQVTSAFFYIAESNVDLFNNEMILRLIEKFSNDSSKIRFRSLLVLEKLITKIGESIVTVVPSLHTALSGLLTDNNRKVADKTDTIVRLLNQEFKDSDEEE
uniref:HEAT repeat-containing protein 1 n=1 Tax=Rhabditophanes sp. KR3021 TaxID=114890 RepID=A0AC35U1Z8_9BILA